MSKQVSKKEKKATVQAASPFWTKHKFNLLVFFSAFFIYFNSIPNNYNLDDEMVTRNHRLTSKGISAIPQIFTEPYYKDASGYAYEYRPMVLVSFAIEHSFFGDSAHVSHFINVLLYALLCVLLFICLQKLLPGYGTLLPLIATLVFVVHPAHTEVVDSIKNRDEILALGLGLLSLWFALSFADTSKWYYVLLSGLCFMVAILSKQSVLPLAVVIPLALILFRSQAFYRVMALTVLLLLPVIVYVPLDKLSMRVLLLIGSLLAVTGFYVYVNKIRGFADVANLSNKLGTWLKSSFFKTTLQQNNEQTTEFIADHSSITIPVLLGAGLLTLVVYSLAIYCLSYAHTYLFAAVVCGFVVFCFVGNDAVKKLLFIPSFLLVITAAYAFGVSPVFYTSVYLTAATVYFMYYKGQFRWVAAPVALVCVLIDFVGAHEFLPPLFEVLPVVLLTNKRWHNLVRGIAGFSIFLGLVYPFINFLSGTPYQYEDNIRFILIALLIVVTYRPKAIGWFSYFIPATLVFNFLFLLAIIHVPSPPYYTPVSEASIDKLKVTLPFAGKAAEQVRSGGNTLTKAAQTDLNDKTTDRPVSFIEAPVKHDSPLSLRFGTSLVSVSHYLYKIALPYPMSFYYGYKFIEPTEFLKPVPLITLAVYLLLFFTALFFVNRNRIISFSIFVFLAGIAAVSNYLFPLPGSIADRFMFLPSLGWSILLTYVVLHFTKTNLHTSAENYRQATKPAAVILGIVLFLYSGITFARNFQWKDHLTLFRHDIDYVNESAQAHNLLGVQLVMYSGQLPQGPEQFKMREEAIPHFKKSTEIYPDFFNPVYDAARVYTMINQPDSALAYFKKAAAMNPAFYESHLSCAEILARAGKWNEAIPYLEHITKNYPAEGRAYDLLSLIYYQMKNYETSIAVNRAGMKYVPTSPNPPTNIGRVYETALNRPDSALYYYRIALQLNPNDMQMQQTVQRLQGVIH